MLRRLLFLPFSLIPPQYLPPSLHCPLNIYFPSVSILVLLIASWLVKISSHHFPLHASHTLSLCPRSPHICRCHLECAKTFLQREEGPLKWLVAAKSNRHLLPVQHLWKHPVYVYSGSEIWERNIHCDDVQLILSFIILFCWCFYIGKKEHVTSVDLLVSLTCLACLWWHVHVEVLCAFTCTLNATWIRTPH